MVSRADERASADLDQWYRRIAGISMKLGTGFGHRAHISEALVDKPGHMPLGGDICHLPPANPTIDVLAVWNIAPGAGLIPARTSPWRIRRYASTHRPREGER